MFVKSRGRARRPMNIIPPSHLLAPAHVTHNASDVLEACNVASMVGALQQLGLLAQRAHEIFDGLAAEAGRGADRVARLQGVAQCVRVACIHWRLEAAGGSGVCHTLG